MKKVIFVLLVASLLIIILLPGVCAENTAFTLSVSGPSEYQNGSVLNIVITVNDITLTDGMSYVSFRLYYDAVKVSPVVKSGFSDEAENRTTFITNCPDAESWEVVGVLNETEGYYELTFGTEDIFMTKIATDDGELIFTIPFRVAGDATENISFILPEEYVTGGNKDLSEVEVKGKVNDLIVPKYASVVSFENSNDTNSSTELSETSDETSGSPIDHLALYDNATATITNGYLLGLTDKITVEQIKSMFRGTVTVSGTGTGATVSAGGQTVVIVIKGDISGDGKIDGKDYLFAKRSFLGTINLSEAQLKAGRLGGTTGITAQDYLKIKRHFLGSYNLFL